MAGSQAIAKWSIPAEYEALLYIKIIPINLHNKKFRQACVAKFSQQTHTASLHSETASINLNGKTVQINPYSKPVLEMLSWKDCPGNYTLERLYGKVMQSENLAPHQPWRRLSDSSCCWASKAAQACSNSSRLPLELAPAEAA